ncbi:Hypothetical_protein [Hexamita inflata]|uniref:Hypothetical_protein n=1 Tax=Hexamita inflata TaxID=28002 RepID=A0ABP1HWH6_9EUKA
MHKYHIRMFKIMSKCVSIILKKTLTIKLDWRKEQEDPTIGVRTRYVIYNQQRKHWACRGPPCSSSTGSIQTILGLNHEKQWRTFSFNLNRELKMKSWYFAQLELQFRQLQSLSFSKYKQ